MARSKPQKPRKPPLAEVLRFKHDETIARFCKNFYIERADAKLLFEDMVRYLWLAMTVPEAEKLQPVYIVDEMWHTFLMYTTEYVDFSFKYFGRYLHHIPNSAELKRSRARLARTNPKRLGREAHEDRTKSITLVWDHLGERVALRWYVTYQLRYDERFFQNRRPMSFGTAVIPQALVERAARFER